MKDITNYEGLYAVTENGEVFSYRSKRFIKPFLRKNGYLQVILVKDGIKKAFKLHRLVAQEYLCNPDNKEEVNHLNENKTDNRVENLAWATRKENMNHGTITDRISDSLKKLVKCIELDITFNSITEASIYINRSPSCISDALNGRSETAGGYHWQYI